MAWCGYITVGPTKSTMKIPSKFRGVFTPGFTVTTKREDETLEDIALTNHRTCKSITPKGIIPLKLSPASSSRL